MSETALAPLTATQHTRMRQFFQVLGNTLVDCAKPNDGRIIGLADGSHRCPDGARLVELAAEYCVEP